MFCYNYYHRFKRVIVIIIIIIVINNQKTNATIKPTNTLTYVISFATIGIITDKFRLCLPRCRETVTSLICRREN